MLTIEGDLTSTATADPSILTTSLNLGGAERLLTVAQGTTHPGPGPLSGSQTADLQVHGVISNGSLAKAGPGELLLAGAGLNTYTYTGTTTVREGTIELDKDPILDTNGAIRGNIVIGDKTGAADTAVIRLLREHQILAASNEVLVRAPGLLDLRGNSETIHDLAIAGGRVATGAGTLIALGTITVNPSTEVSLDSLTSRISGRLDLGGGTRVFNVQNNLLLTTPTDDLDVSAALSNGSWEKIGAGQMVLSGTASNTLTGTTTVSQGELILNKDPVLAPDGAIVGDLTIQGGTVQLAANDQILATAGNSVTVYPSGTLDLNGFDDTIELLTMAGGHVVTGTGTLTIASGQVNHNGSSLSSEISGNVDLNGAPDFNVGLGTVADGNDMVVSAVLTNGDVTKSGSGQLVLSGSNGYTGTTNINAGTVAIASDSNLGDPSASLALDGGTLRSTTTTTVPPC